MLLHSLLFKLPKHNFAWKSLEHVEQVSFRRFFKHCLRIDNLVYLATYEKNIFSFFAVFQRREIEQELARHSSNILQQQQKFWWVSKFTFLENTFHKCRHVKRGRGVMHFVTPGLRHMTEQGRVVKNCQHLVDVIYEWSLDKTSFQQVSRL